MIVIAKLGYTHTKRPTFLILRYMIDGKLIHGDKLLNDERGFKALFSHSSKINRSLLNLTFLDSHFSYIINFLSWNAYCYK